MATTVSHSHKHCDNSTDLEANSFTSISNMEAVNNVERGAVGGRPIFHQKANGKGALENRPKSGGKILIRKNTPALLPTVDTICAKGVTLSGPTLTEEEEEEESGSNVEQVPTADPTKSNGQ